MDPMTTPTTTPGPGAASDSLASRDKGFLLGLYERMFLIREFEEQVKYLFLAGSMPGTIHQCQGQEATAVGVCSALAPDDYVTSTHRPHGHALAKGLTPLEILIELFGKGAGCCKGKGGSMHVGNLAKGMPPAIAIVGGGLPLATGMALAFKMQKRPAVVACFFGEGATSEGAFHEAVNMGAIWDLPVVYACENNLYGASTHISKVMRAQSVAERCSGYRVPCRTVDGNDVVAVHDAAREAVAECRAGKGPVLLELLTYRMTGHSRRDPCHYQPKAERQAWAQRDPIETMSRRLLQRDDITAGELEQIRNRVSRQITADIETARREPEPTLADLTTDVYA
ncbi:MAG: thiamine pyrophosphate-dependent dehydrogenase E1 component subunit alpha [Planctomycetes bacterium]|nr:thiamine pyrophosphate-dependent dehydrogenase E1 component subunit alpha [Planctomycetota bacterium]